MGRLLGLVLLVLGVWAAAEIYANGFDAAFGGALAGLDDPVVPLDELHSGGGRGAPARRAASSDDDDDILVIEGEDPFPAKQTPVQRVGAHVQGEIDASFEKRYRDP
jgi:hypothetical protein